MVYERAHVTAREPGVEQQQEVGSGDRAQTDPMEKTRTEVVSKLVEMPVAEKERALLVAPRIRVELVSECGVLYERPILFPRDVVELLEAEACCWDRERLLSIALDAGHYIIGIEEVSVGTASSCPVHPREVMKALILANATAFIVAHNHPCGRAEASQADKCITRTLEEAGELLGIALIDHVIIGHGGEYSSCAFDWTTQRL